MRVRSIGLIGALAALVACDGPQWGPGCPAEPGNACTWAGVKGLNGFNADGLRRDETVLDGVADLSFAPDGTAWIADWNNHRIRRIGDDGIVQTLIGNAVEGDGALDGSDREPVDDPVGAPGPAVMLNHQTDIDFLPDGKVVVAGWHTRRVRVLDPATGMVEVIAGTGSVGASGDGGPAHAARFGFPKSVAIDGDGRIYVLDQTNQRIRLLDNGSPRVVTTIAGSGEFGDSGDGGPATGAAFGFELGVAPDPSGALALRDGVLYIADTMNHRIRRLDLETGRIEGLAGTGEAGYSGDGGPALEARFDQPNDLELGPDGRLYVADSNNNVIRAIDLSTGVIERVAGNAEKCSTPLFCQEDIDEPHALDELQLLDPWGIAFDPAGDLYIADHANSRIVKVSK